MLFEFSSYFAREFELFSLACEFGSFAREFE